MSRQILAIIALACVSAPQALAHAVLLAAVPAANQSIGGQDIDVKLHFKWRIDSARSRLALSLPDGSIGSLSVRQSWEGVLGSRNGRCWRQTAISREAKLPFGVI